MFNHGGTVTVLASTFTGNAAVGGGGASAGTGLGGAVFSRNGVVTITSSTLSANLAAGGGTGLYVLADAVAGGPGDVTLTGAATTAVSASVLGQADGSVADLVTAANGAGAAVTATGSGNLIRSTSVTGVGNLSSGDPLLSPLQDNGGPTPTMAPLPGSPAVDAGGATAPGGAVTDQRGAGYPRVVGATLDAGAVEVDAAAATPVLLPLSVPAAQPGVPYAVGLSVTGPAGPYTFAVTAGALPPGVTLSPPTGDRTAALAGTPTAAGTYTFTLTATNGAGAAAARPLTLTVAPVTISEALPVPQVAVPYRGTVYAVGGGNRYTFAVTAGVVPPGLALAANGVLSGTPTAIGTFSFTVTATGPAGATVSRSFALAVAAAVVVSPSSVPPGQVGAGYALQLAAAGQLGPFTYAVTGGALPAGLTLSPGGLLAGTPAAVGTFTFTVTATTPNGFRGARTYSLVVTPIVVGPATLPAGQAGAAYSRQLTASGPPGPFAYAVTGGALPAGLTLSVGGQLAGTPASGGTFTFTVTATTTNGFSGARTYSLVVAPIVVGPASLPAGQAQAAYAQQLTASGAPGPFAYAVTGGALPAGLTLSAGGLLAGTPTADGTFTFTVTATATAGGYHGSQTFSFLVYPFANTFLVTSLADDGSPGTLRAALAVVNADPRPTADVIAFAVDGVVTLAGGVLTLSRMAGSVTITSAGHAVVIDAHGASNVFTVNSGVTAGLTGLTLRGGSGGGFLSPGGGAVSNSGTTTLTACTLTGNSSGIGGAVWNSGTATLTACTLTGNTAIFYGGAVWNSGTLVITDSTVTGNSSLNGAALQNTSAMTVSGSIVSGNTFQIPVAAGPDVAGAVTTDGGYNLFGTSLQGATGGTGNVYTDAPGVAALADNGGPTPTMALQPGSPALDAGRPTDATADQRGAAVQNGRRDIGAFEAGAFPPVAADDAATITEDGGPVLIDVLANDAPASGAGPLTVTAVAQPAVGGTVTLVGGVVAFTPAADFSGTATFTYRVRGPDGVTAAAAVVVSVTPVNDAPAAAADAATTAEDAAVTVAVTANDTDPDGDVFAVTAVTPPAHGVAAVTAGGVTYTPAADFHGTDTFTYTVADGHGGTATATVTVTVTPTNDPPTAAPDTITVAEDAGPTVVDVLGNDGTAPDTGETLTVVAVVQPAHGTVTRVGVVVRYTPAADYFGADSFTYTVSDGNGGTATATVSVTVGSVNDPPTAGADTLAVAEDAAATVVDVLANDRFAPDVGETLTVASVTQPAHGSTTLVGGVVRYTPAANFNGSDGFTYTVSDGNGGTATGIVVVTVSSVNDLPTAATDVLTVVEDSGPTVVGVLANDTAAPDVGETLTVTAVTQPAAGGSVTMTGGVVRFTPAANYNGAAAFTYTVSDGNGGTATATVTITVTPVNDPPTAGADTLTVAEDGGSTLVHVLANDTAAPDVGETLTVIAVGQPATGGSVAIAGGGVWFTPAPNFSGPTSFTYTVSDGSGGTATGTVSVTVAAVNDPPTARADTLAVAEDAAPTVVGVLANDGFAPDTGETLTVTAVAQPGHGEVTLAGGVVRYAPTAGYNGNDSFTYTVSDGNGGTATATVFVTVTPVNDPPTAAGDALAVAEDAAATIVGVLANDSFAPDLGETLTVVAVGAAGHGTVTLTSGVVRYAPAANYNGADSFTYTVSDGNGGTATATVSVTVTPANDPPTAAPDTHTVTEDSVAAVVAVLGNDSSAPDAGETLTVTAVTQPGHGTVTLDGGVVRYAPAADFFGSDSFTYTLSDGSGGTATGTVTVVVMARNDPPTAAADAYAVGPGPTTLKVLENDTSAPDTGEQLVVAAVSQPAAGGLAAVAPGGAAVTFTPATGFVGTVTFTYTVSDGSGGTTTAGVSLSVTGARPVAVGGTPDGSVRLVAADGTVAAVSPFGFTGTLTRTVVADVDGDGVSDLVAATGPGTPLRVAVMSGTDNSVLVAPFDPFGGDFPGGGYLAAADLDGDGRAEYVVTPDQGGGPRVSVFTRNPDGSTTLRANFFGIDDANFRGGARAALGDVNGDGTPDVVVAAGFGGGPRTAIFAGQSVLAGAPTRLVGDFFAFPGSDVTNLRNGSFIAVGDVDGDGFAELVFGGGPGGAPRMFILSGALVAAGRVDAAQASPLANFFVGGDLNDRGGVRVAVTNADGDAKVDVAAGSGPGRPARVRVYLGKDFAAGGEPAVTDIDVFGGAVLTDGMYVG